MAFYETQMQSQKQQTHPRTITELHLGITLPASSAFLSPIVLNRKGRLFFTLFPPVDM